MELRRGTNSLLPLKSLRKMISPTEIEHPPTFEEILAGDWKTYPADDRDLTASSEVLLHGWPDRHSGLTPYSEIPHAMTDGEFVYYSVAVDIPPVRKTIGRPKTVRREVWVRGTFDHGRPNRWEGEDYFDEPINPDGDGVFRSLTNAVIYSTLERKSRELTEAAWGAEVRWDDKHCRPPEN